MLVGGGDEAFARLAVDAAGAATNDACLVLEVLERRLPGGGVRLVDSPADLLVAECVEQADALWDGEDEVEAGDRPQRLLLESPLAGSIFSTVIVRALGCRLRNCSLVVG